MIREELLLLFCGLLIGGYIGWLLHPESPLQREDTSPAVAVRQNDGSLVAQRVAASKPSAAPHALPKGSREQRRIAVTVQPRREDCPPLRLDLSVVEQDSGRRVIASSPDGTVLDALDLPLLADYVSTPRRRWSTGASLDLDRTRPGLWLDHDLGRFRIGAELMLEENGALQARAKLGFIF